MSALEAALTLRVLAGERVALTIATPASVFPYRPLAVMRPFQAAVSYRLELGRIAADLDARFAPEAAVAVDVDSQRLLLAGGRQLGYDALLVAIGARAEAVLTGGTLTLWDWGEGHAFRSLLGSLTDGRTRRVAFIVPAGLTWPLPLNELALLTSACLRERAIRGVSLQLISAEPAPLGVSALGFSAQRRAEQSLVYSTGATSCSRLARRHAQLRSASCERQSEQHSRPTRPPRCH